MDHNPIAVELFDKYASEYAAKFMDVSMYDASLDALCAAISKQDAAVLEIACGPGNVTRYLLDKRPDLQILGTDLAPKMLALAQQNNPNARFQLLDGRAILQLRQQYDAIVCGFFLPYLTREEAIRFIADAATILRPGGVLFLSTMEDDYNTSGWRKGSQGDEIFMYFHESGYLLEALADNGFEVLDLRRQAYPPTGKATATDLLVLALKH